MPDLSRTDLQVVNDNLSLVLTLSSGTTVEYVDGGSQPDTILGNALVNRIDSRSGEENLRSTVFLRFE